MKRYITFIALSLLVLSAAARRINIHGSVTVSGSGEPAAGVAIYDASNKKMLGITGEEGRFYINSDSEGELLFSGLSVEETTVPVDGRLEINLALLPKVTELEEFVVTAKGSDNSISADPTDLDLTGNYLRFKTRVKIPAKRFDSQTRAIIQPSIYNVTNRHLTYLTPVVYDGWRYADTQERMYDWDITLDPLTTYRQVKSDDYGKESLIFVSDSMYVTNPKDDFLCVIITTLENYNRLTYGDTIEIARGTVNPLRFLQYSLNALSVDEDKFLPTPEVELRDASGEMKLVFPVGKSNLDLDLANNRSEFEAMLGELDVIKNAPDMTLKSFKIFGYASPEGNYERNKQLAAQRIASAMKMVEASTDESLRRNAELSTDADVASWSEVITMMRADSLMEEADQVQAILDKYSSPNSQSTAVTRLPIYKTIIRDNYLPRLRRVSYNIVSSRYRPLTDEEIAELYVKNPKGLSKYQFYRYFTSHEGEECRKALETALEVYPDFVVAATELAKIKLENGENPKDILDPFFNDPASWDKLPVATRYNMGIACIDTMNYSRADSIMATLPDIEQTHKGKIYSQALTGHYSDVMAEISEDSPLNEVLLMLAIKDNKNAYEKANKLGDSAVEEYIKAVAANRVDDYVLAIAHIKNAFKLDPSLIDVAKVDGDLTDLLAEEDLFNDEPTNTDY